MTEPTESRKPGWYLLYCSQKYKCAHLPDDDWMLSQGWSIGPAVADLLCDAERMDWLVKNEGPPGLRSLIDAEIRAPSLRP